MSRSKSKPKQSSQSNNATGEIQIRCAYGEMIPIESVRPYPRNPWRHPPEQLRLLCKIIQETGWRNPIVVSRRSGYVVKGHGRLEAARLLGMVAVPVDLQDYATDEEEKADRIADNKIAELAEVDLEDLLAEMGEMQSADMDMELAGMGGSDLEELLDQLGPAVGGEVDAEPQIDKADELREKWGVETGQLWELGDHRILCGDSTKAEDVERVLAGDKPLLMVTDPPYGVEYDPDWRTKASAFSPTIGKAFATGKVLNDDRADWSEAWALFPGDVIYIWHASSFSPTVAESLESCGFERRALICWAKNHLVIGRGNYHHQHEPCWYAVRKGKKSFFHGGRKQTTVWKFLEDICRPAENIFVRWDSPEAVECISSDASTLWEIDKPQKSETGHSTQKPVECMARPIRNHKSEFVYEPFSGSGTTIIACEQLGRKCRAIEISPGYVAVAIQRWADATGKEPRRL